MNQPSSEAVLYANLRSIKDWIDAHNELPPLNTTAGFVGFSVEIMNRALYLLRVGVALAPDEQRRSGVSRNKAIVLGHVVRLMKLYDCLLLHTSHDRLEICMIFVRLIHETIVKMSYLQRAKRSSFRSFVLVSYRPEKDHLADLRFKARQRRLIPIERRILRSVTTHLRDDGITQRALLQNRSWDLDGKNFRALLRDTGIEEWAYSYMFGNGSHFVHGDWRDLTMHHLVRDGRRYLPKPDYRAMDPRVTCAVTTLSLQALHAFLRWYRSDPDQFVRPIVSSLAQLNQRLDDAHERFVQQRAE